jgi:hypothetical protein
VVARGEGLKNSLDSPPCRRAAEQDVSEHPLLDLEGRAIIATVDVHGHDQTARLKPPPSSIQRSVCRRAFAGGASEIACNAVRGPSSDTHGVPQRQHASSWRAIGAWQ